MLKIGDIPYQPLKIPEGADVCPNCLSTAVERGPAYIRCRQCGLNGDPAQMKFCEKVPLFKPIDQDRVYTEKGLIFEHKRDFYDDDRGELYVLLNYHARGCGRPVPGAFCESCRPWMPTPWKRQEKRGRAPGRKIEGDGKAAALGDREEE